CAVCWSDPTRRIVAGRLNDGIGQYLGISRAASGARSGSRPHLPAGGWCVPPAKRETAPENQQCAQRPAERRALIPAPCPARPRRGALARKALGYPPTPPVAAHLVG